MTYFKLHVCLNQFVRTLLLSYFQKQDVDHLKNFQEACAENSGTYVEYLKALLSSKE